MFRRPHFRSLAFKRLAAWTNRESLLLAIVGIVVAAVLIRLPEELQQDGWLTLVAGREIVWNGLPHTDTLTAWTHGVRWVDQQWLAQLFFYGLERAGGLRLVLFAHALLVSSAFVLAVAAARLRGGSARATSLVAAVALFPIVMGSWQMRAQSLAFLLYVALLWLLISDSRSPGRRVLLVLSLLVLWANIHGSVVLAAALVALYGGVLVFGSRRLLEDSRRRLGTALIAGAAVAPFVSPYGLELLGYYHSTLFNSGFAALVVEWGATTPSLTTAPFYLLGFGTVWLLGRASWRITRFEQIALLITLVGGLHTLRNMVWFSLLALIVLPTMLGEALRDGYQPFSRIRVAVPAIVGTAVVAVAVTVAVKPSSWFERDYSADALRRVEAVASKDPSAGLYANERYADWLLWKVPRLRGRVAYDARFELLTNRQLVDLYFWRSRIGAWRESARSDRILVVDAANDRFVEKDLLADGAAIALYRNADIAVLDQRSPAIGTTAAPSTDRAAFAVLRTGR